MIVVDARMINFSGIGRYIRSLLPFLMEHFDVSLLTTYKMEAINNLFRMELIPCKSSIYSLQEQIELSVRIPKSDLFWSPHYNIPIFPIRAKKRMVTIHDVYHLAFQDKLKWHQRMYAKFMIKQAIEKSDIILTVSEFSKQEILKYVNTSKEIKVIYNGIDQGWCIQEPLSLHERDDYILYVGNVKPHKNLVRALTAFSLLKRKSPVFKDLKFKIVGKKDNFITKDNEVEKIAKEMDNYVEFTGYVSNNELKKLYRKAKLFIFPSFYEGFGLPPLEAMACGTPVVVSNVASLPEVCGDAAYYVNPYDINDIARGIEAVLKDEILQKELVQKGLERAKLFSWEKSAKKLIEVIEEVVES